MHIFYTYEELEKERIKILINLRKSFLLSLKNRSDNEELFQKSKKELKSEIKNFRYNIIAGTCKTKDNVYYYNFESK